MYACMHKCVHTEIYECIYSGMYVGKHAWVHIHLCVPVWVYVCTHECMYMCVHACVSDLYCHVTVHIFDMSLNKYGCHIANMRYSHYAKLAYRPNSYAYVWQNMSNCNSYFTCYCHVYVYNKYAYQCHISKSVYAHYTTMSVYMCHMDSLQSTMRQQTLIYIYFTLLAYIPEQICLPHYTCMSICSFAVVFIYTQCYCIYQ